MDRRTSGLGVGTWGEGRRRNVGWTLGMAIVALSGGCAGVKRPEPPPSIAITCNITRSECAEEFLSLEDALGCGLYTTGNMITATTCYNSATDGTMADKCKADFCGLSQSRNGTNGDCTVTSAFEALLAPSPTAGQGVGTCIGESNETRFASVTFGSRYLKCILDDSTNVSCNNLLPTPRSGVDDTMTVCMDVRTPILPPPGTLSPYPIGGLGPPFDQYGTINIQQIELDWKNCPALGAQSSDLTYSVPAGPIATASGGGVSAPISATGGTAIVEQNCSDDVLGCLPTSLDRLELNASNLSVAGATLSNVVISSVAPAAVASTFNEGAPPSFSVPAGGLSLLVSGDMNGVPAAFLTGNGSPLGLTANATGFSLTGTFTIQNEDASGHPLSISVATNVTGTPATGQALACAQENGLQRLFGFEDLSSWTSSQATLSEVTSPVTQGCGALGIDGQGYMTINGQPFMTSGLTLAPALSVDLFIPNNQPNQFYLGALQMYLTCPSGNVFNAYIGQDELTGKPQNAYSTLRYPLPSNVTSTLQQGLSDCSFSFALNANQTGKTWILDNLRFTP